MNMRNIVLDTNSLIIAISAKNDCHKVWQSFLNGDYTLCISNEIVEEYLEVMSRNINKYVAEAIIYTILTRTYSGAYPFTFRQLIKHKNSL